MSQIHNLGALTINVPHFLENQENQTVSQGYVFDMESVPYTGNTNFNYIGIGTSRINEFELYGGGYDTSSFTYGTTTDEIAYTGYSFTYTGPNTNATIFYRDRADGFTEIAGSTSGFTKEEVFQQALTRNEHFLGFVEQPRIYSDLFVDRGKQGVQEKNLRLGEIDNIGELERYGNGYFKIRKQ